MPQQNDSTRWLRVAQEASWATMAPYVVTIPQSGAGGSFSTTVDGQTVANGYNVTAPQLQSSLATLTTVGANMVLVTGSVGAYTITFLGDVQAKPVSFNFAAITGAGSNTVTGGASWITIKIAKTKHKMKSNVKLDEEERNGPDAQFEDSISSGGQYEEWDWSGGVRADQFGHYLALVGFADTKGTHAGETVVYDHVMKPGMPPNFGKSYAVQMYNGQNVFTSRGVVGSELTVEGKGGESSEDTFSFKGWGMKAFKLASVPSIVLPSNTSYRKTKPTNTGRAISFAGGAANGILSDFKIAWKRPCKPLFSQTGTVDPYRASYGKRSAEVSVTLHYDDPTEFDQARSTPAPARSFQVVMPHSETVGTVPTNPSLTINVPSLIWTDPDIDAGDETTKVSLSGGSTFNTAQSAQIVVTVVNQDNVVYA